MARSKLTDSGDDLINDSGTVLWSFVKGEQLEFPVIINFIANPAGYTFEAVVVEALNTTNQTAKPVAIQPGGIQTVLVVRVPTNRGTWDAGSAYNTEDVILYNGLYYKLLSGTARVSASLPNVDPLWEVTVLNKVYIQFPKTLGTTWSITGTVGFPTYGFFELRVTEPSNSILTKTWKPVRGMVEVLFSPTEIVADV
jgi:hypothetical protein